MLITSLLHLKAFIFKLYCRRKLGRVSFQFDKMAYFLMKVFRAEMWKHDCSSALRSATAEPSASHPDTHLLSPPQGGFPSGLDSVRGTRHHGLVERVHRDRNRINSPHRRPVDKHGRQISFHFYVGDSRRLHSVNQRCDGVVAYRHLASIVFLGLVCFFVVVFDVVESLLAATSCPQGHEDLVIMLI